MKNFGLIIVTAAVSALLSACNGDHMSNDSKDTASTTSVGNYDVRTNIDTSKVTHTTGDASVLDNTASGGVMVAKDTTHIKVRSVNMATVAASAPAAAPAKDTTAAATPKK